LGKTRHKNKNKNRNKTEVRELERKKELPTPPRPGIEEIQIPPKTLTPYTEVRTRGDDAITPIICNQNSNLNQATPRTEQTVGPEYCNIREVMTHNRNAVERFIAKRSFFANFFQNRLTHYLSRSATVHFITPFLVITSFQITLAAPSISRVILVTRSRARGNARSLATMNQTVGLNTPKNALRMTAEMYQCKLVSPMQQKNRKKHQSQQEGDQSDD
jgi:hypothetical protein